MKRKWIWIIGALAIVATIIGLTVMPALAQNNEPARPEPGARCEEYLNKVASNLGTDFETLSAAMLEARIQMVDDLVAAGRITEDQAESIKAKIAENGVCSPLRIRDRCHRGFGPGPGPLGVIERAVEQGIITREQADEVQAILEQVKAYIEDNGCPGIGPRDGEMIDRAVEQGIITREQADTITSVLDSIRQYAQENGLQLGPKGDGCRGQHPMSGNGEQTGQRAGECGPMGMMGFGART